MVVSQRKSWKAAKETRADIDFDQAIGMAGNVDIRSLKSSKDLTDQVWQLLVTQTNLYAEQK